ncbi:phosphatase PAP2 family protein [Pseudomonas mediterranea]|uniref:undecaprenyl-diphosphate phosphatase n=1 Tax=Pseudomonas mediterranea TaxID=183795 RepID=A0AAX2D6A5_9PSED|nr:phosphatase PAP2 family protein [Pseudomonas mediterranea]SDU13672.1 undecaprenyl-diphosphatase [Pseudomonas mediterranea]
MGTNANALCFLVGVVLMIIFGRFLVRSVLLKTLKSRSTGADVRFEFRHLLAAAVITGCLILVQACLVLKWSGMAYIDAQVNALFEPFRTPWLLQLFVQVTSLGTILSMGVIAVIVSALLWSMGRLAMLIPLWSSFLGAEVTTWTVKYGIDRARPDFLQGITEANPSFPSGHATAATVVFGFIGFIIARELPTRSLRVEVGFWSAMVITAICLSRLFLSLHYLSDVICGSLVGSFWLLMGVAFVRWQSLTNEAVFVDMSHRREH